MTPTLLVLDSGLTGALETKLGTGAEALHRAFLQDTYGLAQTVAPVRIVSTAVPLDRSLASSLRNGPVVLISGNLPHLPPYRIRDAFTYLHTGADLVIGPAESGDWYLLGMRLIRPKLLEAVPAYGDSADSLIAAAQDMDLRVQLLPGWYTIHKLNDLGRLADDLRTMPAEVAPQTRALFHDDLAQSRAVGG